MMVAYAKSFPASVLHDNGTFIPAVKDMFAYQCAVRRLQHVRQSIERAMEEQAGVPTAFSLLLVEHKIWTRYLRRGRDLWMTVHTRGPDNGEPIVLTGEVVLDAIAAGQLSVESAFERGLIVIKAPASVRRELKTLLNYALTDRGREPLRIFPMHFPGKPR